MIEKKAFSALGAGAVLHTIGDLLTGAAQRAIANTGTTSLVEVTSVARVEPNCFISNEAATWDHMPEVAQSLVNIFMGYYLQAFALTSNVDNVKPLRILDRLNPNRSTDLAEAIRSGFATEKFTAKGIVENDATLMWRMSTESYKFNLPTTINAVAMEDEQSQVVKKAVSSISDTSDTIAMTKEVTNLSVGKMFSVKLVGENGTQVTLPIALRLMMSTAPDSALTAIMVRNGTEIKFNERFWQARAGSISFINDLLLHRDLMKERRKMLAEDRNGVYKQIVSQSSKNRQAGFITNNPSLNMASNIIVVTSDLTDSFKSKLGGDISSPRIRERIFENSNAMIIVVINKLYDRVTFYHRGLAAATTVSVKDLKASNKNTGPDVLDIMKAYTMQSAISI